VTRSFWIRSLVSSAVTPVVYEAVTALLAVIQVLLASGLIGLILMHSGRDTGFGGMGFTPASQGGTHIVERNLTRLTVVVAALFFCNSIALFHILK
jgi:preprotein translocase subunit SecG